MGEYITGGKSLTAIRPLRDAHASKDEPVLQQCPGYDIKLHPLRELTHFGPQWCNLLGPQLRQRLGRQVREALVRIPF